MSVDRHARTMLPIPDRPAPGLTTYDAKDPDTAFPPIEPLLPPPGCAERADRPPRRRRLRRVERVRWAVQHPDGGTARRRRAALQPLPHDGAVRADAPGDAHRPQPPLGGDGQHHRDGDVRPGQQLVAAEHQGAAGDDVEAERVLDGAVRQVPRGARCGSRRRWVRSTPGRRAAAGSRRSTASSAARTTSGTRRCTTAPRRSSRRRRPRRATTSPRTSPTMRSAGCVSRRR